MITSAIGLALCYVNRMQRKYAFGDTINYRILVIKGSEDSSNQYMSFMNMVFSAEKFVNHSFSKFWQICIFLFIKSDIVL